MFRQLSRKSLVARGISCRLLYCIAILAGLQVGPSLAFEYQSLTIDHSPTMPSTSDRIYLSIADYGGGILDLSSNGVVIDNVNREVKISLNIDFNGFLPLPPFEIPVPLGNLNNIGDYEVSVYFEELSEEGPIFRDENFIGSFIIAVGPSSAIVSGELPKEGTLEIHNMEVFPALLYESQPFELHLVGYNVTDFVWNIPVSPSEFSVLDDLVFIRSADNGPCFTPSPPLPPNEKPQRRVLSIPGLPAGSYTVVVDISTYCGDWEQEIIRNLVVYENSDLLLFNQEAPASSQVVSGVGVIRGWACFEKTYTHPPEHVVNTPWAGSLIGRVAYQVDEGALVTIPYGSPRGDTAGVCGEGNTDSGYGAVVYWGQFGEGEHQFRLYIDGQEKTDFKFNVIAPEEGFMKGLDAEYDLQNFPGPGDVAKVRWSQADQNFVIVEFNEQ